MKSSSRSLTSIRRRYQIFSRQNGLCAICGKILKEDFQIDHKFAFARGGKTTFDNLQAVHPVCNQKKGIKCII